MAHIGYERNDRGTLVSKHICDTCHRDFVITPAKHPEDDAKGWGSCLATYCASYDPTRDVDKLFDEPLPEGVRVVRRAPVGRG